MKLQYRTNKKTTLSAGGALLAALGLLAVVSYTSPVAARSQTPSIGTRMLPSATPAASLTNGQPGRVMEETFGNQDAIILAIGAYQFRPNVFDGSGGLAHFFKHELYCTDGSCVAFAPITLPAGVKVTKVEVNVFDDAPNGALSVAFARCPVSQSACTAIGSSNSSNEAVYQFFSIDLPSGGHIVNNVLNTYRVKAAFESDSRDVALNSVRIYYQRQISPPPATPSFSDVPKGNIFYGAVEALAAAGITGGCGSGKFCPDKPVTRGQMAAFLSRALGLHWSPSYPSSRVR